MTEDHPEKKALSMAANMISRRPLGRQELFEKLLSKGAPEHAAAAAVSRLCELNVLDDLEYAKELIRHYSKKGYGENRLKQELRKHRIDEETAQAALGDAPPLEDFLEKWISAKLRGKTPDRAEIKRISDALFRRGYTWDQIEPALRKCKDLFYETE